MSRRAKRVQWLADARLLAAVVAAYGPPILDAAARDLLAASVAKHECRLARRRA